MAVSILNLLNSGVSLYPRMNVFNQTIKLPELILVLRTLDSRL